MTKIYSTYYQIHEKMKLCFLFQPHGSFFDILLVFVFFLQTYYDIYFFHILSFYFFLLQINFCIDLLPFVLIFLYQFYHNPLLCLVHFSVFCFFLIISFFIRVARSHLLYVIKKIKTPFLSLRLELFIILIASSLIIYQKSIL